ncbi:LysR family transcriptional regulator [Achromobacter sp. F4_2707]|uniref:LysR family transcriptional regulator n=1 Tax=Achromobacter sp. F4_2707 TaxID=3114286 RepID=UPI0039C70510
MKQGGLLDVRMLRIFEAVAATGNVSRAAEKLGITQSAVSQALAQVERILGTPVFDRAHRPFTLTPAGIALSRRARHIVDDIDRLVSDVREADLASRPAIRVGMIDSFAATAGPAIVKKVTASASQLLLWSGLANSHSQALLNRQLDLIITSDTLEDVDRIVRRVIFTEPFILVVPAQKKKEFEGVSLLQAIQLAPFIRFSARSHFGATIERHLRRTGHSPVPSLEIDTADVVMAMVAAGLGWSITTPLCVLQGRAYLQQIAILPLPGTPFSRTVHQLSREGEYEEMAGHVFQASRSVLEGEIFPLLRDYIPWLDDSMTLS